MVHPVYIYICIYTYGVTYFDVAVDHLRWSGSKIVELSQSERLLEASWNDVDLAQLIWHFPVTLTRTQKTCETARMNKLKKERETRVNQ